MSKISRKEFVSNNSGYSAPAIVAEPYEITPISTLGNGLYKVQGKISDVKVMVSKTKPNLIIHETKLQDKNGSVRCIWFQKPVIGQIDKAKSYVFFGKVETKQGVITLVNPKFTPSDDYIRWKKIYDKTVV